MSETPDQRLERQGTNWRNLMGRERSDPTIWALNYRESSIMDQSLDKRQQHVWFAEAVYLEPEENSITT
jgi:hypothetical protein